MPFEAFEAMGESATGEGTGRGWYSLPVWLRFSAWMLAAGILGWNVPWVVDLVKARTGPPPVIVNR